MGNTTGIKRNLESGGSDYINHWKTGLVQQRGPLYTPISAMGVQLISALDALWDGLNVEISRTMTLQRRFGFSKYSTAQFGVSEFPLAYFSFKNLSGTIKAMVDTPTKVRTFTTSALTDVFTKTSSAQISFAKWQNTVYMCNGNDSDMKKWDGTTVTKFGIAAPVTAPTLSFGAGSLTSVNGGWKYVFVYKNPTSTQPSTASPASASTGNITSQNVTVQGASSSDGQVTKVDIYRTKDGGSVYYFLAEVNNGGTWTYTDSTADTGLNTDLVAPLAHVNDPPPTGMSLLVSHMGRLWGASGGTLYYSGGPDTTNGVGAECWPPGNNFPVPGKITALASTTGGLVVFTSDDAYIVYGENSASFTVPQIWQQNFGVASQNCVAQDGDLIFVFTTKGQLFQFGGNLQEIGWNVQAALGAFNPANVYLALHRSGPDEGLFISDGSTNMYRWSMALQCWSTVFQPVGGVGAIGSIEVSTSNWRLLLGRTAGSGYILNRDTSVFSDDGSAYTAFAIVGSLVVAPPRQVAIINSVLLEASAAGTYPTISVLLNEISGTFTTLPNPVPDPPELKASLTVRMMRHDRTAAQNPLPAHVRHMQVKITFATEAAQNEIYGLGLA